MTMWANWVPEDKEKKQCQERKKETRREREGEGERDKERGERQRDWEREREGGGGGERTTIEKTHHSPGQEWSPRRQKIEREGSSETSAFSQSWHGTSTKAKKKDQNQSKKKNGCTPLERSKIQNDKNSPTLTKKSTWKNQKINRKRRLKCPERVRPSQRPTCHENGAKAHSNRKFSAAKKNI